MAYVAVDEKENETIFTIKPSRGLTEFSNFKTWEAELSSVWLPNGSIEKLIGKKLTWEDEPVELKATITACSCGKNTREGTECLECGERATLREVENE